MGISPGEVAIQRKLTEAFIMADYTDVVLYRSTRTADGAGGVVVGDPVALPAQRMRIIPITDTGSVERFTADGQAVRPTYALLGLYTADMQRWDTYATADGRYEVVFVHANRQYEVKGEVFYRGGA